MKSRRDVFDAGTKEKISRLCRENDVVYLAVYGSHARGEQRRGSDVDIAIKYSPGKKKTLFDLVRLEDRLRKIFRRKVDLGILDSLSKYVLPEVREDLLVLYEKG